MKTALLPNDRLFETGYCVIFARGLSPVEILRRAAGRPVTPVMLSRMQAEAIKAMGEDVDEEMIQGIDFDVLQDSDMFADDGALLRSGSYAGWSFVTESDGAYLGSQVILERTSAGTVALGASLSINRAAWIAYAESGVTLSAFDPLFPENDYGAQPGKLQELTGYRNAIIEGAREESHQNALRVIQEQLGCAVPQELDEIELPSIRIAGVY